MHTTLKIEGMTCENCVKHARAALEAVPGVSVAEVSLSPGLAEVTHEGASVEAMIEAIEEEGYEAKSVE